MPLDDTTQKKAEAIGVKFGGEAKPKIADILGPSTGDAPPKQPTISDILGLPETDLREKAGDVIEALPGAVAKGASEKTDRARNLINYMKYNHEVSLTAPTGDVLPIDFDSKLPMAARQHIAQATNPAEVRLAMEEAFGPENVAQDKDGRTFVQIGGKYVPAESGMLSGILGTMPETAGMMAGAMAGAEMGSALGLPGTLIGGVLGAGLGTAGGRGAIEIGKAVDKRFAQTTEQLAETLGSAAAWGTLFEGIGAGGAALKGPARSFLNWYFGTTTEGKMMTERLLARGAVPPVRTMLPDAKALQYHQFIRNQLSSDTKEARNVTYAQDQLRAMLHLADVPEAQVEEVLNSITTPHAAMSTRQVGDALTRRAMAINDVAERQIEAELKATDDFIAADLRALRDTAARKVDPKMGLWTGQAIREGRRAVSQRFDPIYENIHTMTGEQPVIVVTGMKQAIKQLQSLIPEVMRPPLFKDLLEGPDAITLVRAHELQKTFSDMAPLADLTPGRKFHVMGDVRRALWADMDSSVIGNAPQAVKALRTANRQYRKAIAAYEDETFNQLVNEAEKGLVRDPRLVADMIAHPGFMRRAAKIKSLMTPEQWAQVQAADMQNIVASTAEVSGYEASGLRGRALLDVLRKRGTLLDAVHGREMAESLRQAATRLAVRDGKIGPEALRPGDPFLVQLEKATGARESWDTIVRESPLKYLTSKDPAAVDAAVDRILKKGAEANLEQVFTIFGQNSPEAKLIRQEALRRVMFGTTLKLPSGAKTISGDLIDANMKAFTKRQQDLLFPNGLSQDLRILANEMRFLFPVTERDFGGSLMGAGIKATLPASAPIWAYWVFTGWLLDRPGIAHALAIGFRQPETRQAAKNAMKIVYKSFLIDQAESRRGPK